MNSSTFAEIEIGKRGILTHQRAFATTGHNLANVETEGYSRQRVRFRSTEPLYVADMSRNGRLGQIGSGVEMAMIERIRDQLLDDQILANNDGLEFWQTRENYLSQLGDIFQETDATPTRKVMGQFWQAWQDLASTPASVASREVLVERGISLAEHIKLRYRRLEQLQAKVDQNLRQQVEEVNQMIANIALLNSEIQRSIAIGDNPNDLLDRRDLLVEKVSGYLDITVERDRDPDEFLLHSQGRHLVQGTVVNPFTLQQPQHNRSEVIWPQSEDRAWFRDGSMAALQQLRDEDIASEIRSLDAIAINYADLVNQIHLQASGLDGQNNREFFSYYRQGDPATADYDNNGDGEADSNWILRISGSKQLDPRLPLGIAGQISLANNQGQAVLIEYQPQETIAQVIEKINLSDAQVFARINQQQQLEFRPRIDSENLRIETLADSGALLNAYAGILNPGAIYNADTAGASASLVAEANWQSSPQEHPAATLMVNNELINDATKVAAALPTGTAAAVGDNRAALAIAALAHLPVTVANQGNIADFFAERITRVGAKQQAATVFAGTFNTDLQNLRNLRQSISGVSLDEEFSNMIRFQRGYEAAARFLNDANELLDILINRMGVN